VIPVWPGETVDEASPGEAQVRDDVVVSVRGLARRYPGSSVSAVAGVSFDLHAGEVLALLGPSGCGKSTTLRLIAGFDRPDAGEVWINGVCVATSVRPLNQGSPSWIPPEHCRIGMVFQDYALFPHLNAAENVAFGGPSAIHASPACSQSSALPNSVTATLTSFPEASSSVSHLPARSRPGLVQSCLTSHSILLTRACVFKFAEIC
jgi:ABC-type nitrate/sulfonate/bicarbonate transport system ATPase subunit